MEAIEVVKYIDALGDVQWQVWQSDTLLATFHVESYALRYQSFRCSNLSVDYAALETQNAALREALINEQANTAQKIRLIGNAAFAGLAIPPMKHTAHLTWHGTRSCHKQHNPAQRRRREPMDGDFVYSAEQISTLCRERDAKAALDAEKGGET